MTETPPEAPTVGEMEAWIDEHETARQANGCPFRMEARADSGRDGLKFEVEITTQYWRYVVEAESKDDVRDKAIEVFDHARERLIPYIDIQQVDDATEVGDIG